MQHVFSCLLYATMAGCGDRLIVLLLIQQNNFFATLPWQKNCWGKEDAHTPAFWVRPWRSVPRRLMYGHYHRLMRELRMEDIASFCNYMRMEPQIFDKLVDRLSPRITLQDTNWRKALEPGLNVAVTLRYLASVDRYFCHWNCVNLVWMTYHLYWYVNLSSMLSTYICLCMSVWACQNWQTQVKERVELTFTINRRKFSEILNQYPILKMSFWVCHSWINTMP